MQKAESESLGVEEYEAFELVARELQIHFASGRKNFVVRAPLNLVNYLFNGVLQKSRLPKTQLEDLISGQELVLEARTLRRYISGEARMTWPTFQRLVFWAMSQQWISDWMCRDIISKAHLCEVAQLSARGLLNDRKRLVSPAELRRDELIGRFYENLGQKDLEREEKVIKLARWHNEIRELACSLGLEISD
ncbi:hypothetical protein [Pseudomonas capeferrum]